jgi:hypothetical protein
VLEVAPTQEKPPNPFKLKPKWLKEEDFIKKIKDIWKLYDIHLRESASLQFQQNMKEAKKVAFQWEKDKKTKK